jgi:hypothetical protein
MFGSSCSSLFLYVITIFVWHPLLSSTTTSTSPTPLCLAVAAIFLATSSYFFFGKLLSPLPSFVYDEIVQL